jgi:hypothetical protein
VVTRRKHRHNEGGSSREKESRKEENAENIKYLSSGFTDTDDDGEERSQCLLCLKKLTEDKEKPNKLKRRLEMFHTECTEKIPEC